MNRNQDLAARVREVLLNGRWIANTNFKEQIESTSWPKATQRIANLNSVALLTFHINYYLGGLVKVFDGGTLEISDKYSFDMPPIESKTDWQELIRSFLENAEAFTAHVEKMEDAKLDESFVDEKYGTYLRNIEGVIEHTYYHLGQVSLIKKMLD